MTVGPRGNGGRTWLTGYVRAVVRWRIAVVVALTLVSVFLSSHIGRLEVEVDTPRFLPQDHPYVIAQNELEQTFGGRDIVVIGVLPRNGDVYRPPVLAKVARITDAILSMPGVIRSNLLSLAGRRVKAIRGTPEGMDVHPLMADVPDTAEEVAAIREDVESNPLLVNAVVSSDGRGAQIIADFKLGDEIADYPTLERRIRAITDPERDEQTDVAVGGQPIALSWVSAYSERMKWVFPISVVLIGLLHYHAFRTFQGFIIPLVTALLSVVWALGIMGMLRVEIDPFSSSTPILVLAIAAGHSVQILKRYYEEFNRLRDNHAAVIESSSRIGVVMITAGLISAAGFFSLIVFKTQVMRTFGIFTGIGILSALAIEMTLIPAIRAMIPAPKERERLREQSRGRLDVWLERLVGRLERRPRPVLLGAALLLLVAVIGVLRVEVDNGMKRWYFDRTRLIREDRQLNAGFGGTNTLNFLIEGNEPDAIKEPEVLEAVDGLQRFLETVPGVGKTLSFVDYVKQMNMAMHEDDPAWHRVPESRDLVAQYLLLYSMGGEPGDFDALVDTDYRRANVQVFCHTDSTAFTRELLARVDTFTAANFPPGIRVRPAGPMSYNLALNETLARGKVRNILQIAAIIFMISAALFRSLIGGAFVILPLAVTVLVNFALLGFSGTSLDIPTAAIMGVAVGLGADFAIYFLFRFREELARAGDAGRAIFLTMTTSGKAIVYVSTAVCVGYLVLMMSGFGVHLRMALLMASAIAVSCLATLVLLPPLLIVTRPRFTMRGHPAGTARATEDGRLVSA